MSQPQPQQDHVLRMTRRFRAPRERVFRAFTDLEALRHWWGPDGMGVGTASVDARPGGRYDITMEGDEGQHRVAGTYVEVVEPQRLVFTWQWQRDEPNAEMLVTLLFHDRDGETELELVQERMPSAESADLHEGGWSSSFDCLERFLA